MSNNSSSSGGFPLFAVLGIVFIVLKLTGVIAWSWLWVLAPFWGPLALALALALIAAPFVYYAKRKVQSKVNRGEFDSLFN
jgi:predicted PurR-regulated permease PerM